MTEENRLTRRARYNHAITAGGGLSLSSKPTAARYRYYEVYGLLLASEEPVAGLTETRAEREADVTIYQHEEPQWVSRVLHGPLEPWEGGDLSAAEAQRSRRLRWSVSPEGATRVRYADGTQFVVDETGSKIWTTWEHPLRPTDMALYLLGPIMGFALAMRGVTVLHGTAIVLDGKAVVLMGPSGSGKSTTAAAFVAGGAGLLSEDIAALHLVDGRVLVQPGYPSIRLWPDSTQMIFESADALPLLTPGWEKRNLQVDTEARRQFVNDPLPLGAVYYLEDRKDSDDAPAVEPLSCADGLREMLENTYVNLQPRFRTRGAEFATLSRAATTVPIRRVTPHTDPLRILDLRDSIAHDFRTSSISA